MVNLPKIKEELEKMKCPEHIQQARISLSSGTLEIQCACCEKFKKLLLISLAVLIGGQLPQ